jgi:hypothetical protein
MTSLTSSCLDHRKAVLRRYSRACELDSKTITRTALQRGFTLMQTNVLPLKHDGQSLVRIGHGKLLHPVSEGVRE